MLEEEGRGGGRLPSSVLNKDVTLNSWVRKEGGAGTAPTVSSRISAPPFVESSGRAWPPPPGVGRWAGVSSSMDSLAKLSGRDGHHNATLQSSSSCSFSSPYYHSSSLLHPLHPPPYWPPRLR